MDGAAVTGTIERGPGHRWLRVAAGAAAAAVVVASTGGWALQNRYVSQIKTVDPLAFIPAASRPTVSPLAGDAMNILVVGNSSREGIAVNDLAKWHLGRDVASYGNATDTMMIVHIGRDTSHVSVVGLPRDSLVTIPAWKGTPAHEDKINTAFTEGGVPLMYQTVEQATGIHLDHYIEVGFSGFLDMVDAVGGVDVCLSAPLKDDPKYTSLNLPAGMNHLDPVTALNFVRSRHSSADSDFGRIRHQQQFLASMLKKAMTAGMLLDPIKLDQFVQGALRSLTVDKSLKDPAVIDSLAARVQGVNLGKIEFATIPIAPGKDNYSPAGTNLQGMVVWDPAGSEALFRALRDDAPLNPSIAGKRVPPTKEPSSITVAVVNGTTTKGLGRKAADALGAVGFVLAGPATSGRSTTPSRTTVFYDPGYGESLRTLKASLPYASFHAKVGQGSTFTVVVGTDYHGAAQVKVNAAAASAPHTNLASEVVCPA